MTVFADMEAIGWLGAALLTRACQEHETRVRYRVHQRAQRIEQTRGNLRQRARTLVSELTGVSSNHPSLRVHLEATDEEIERYNRDDDALDVIWVAVELDGLTFVYRERERRTYLGLRSVCAHCGRQHDSLHLETLADLGAWLEKLGAGCPEPSDDRPPAAALQPDDEITAAIADVVESEAATSSETASFTVQACLEALAAAGPWDPSLRLFELILHRVDALERRYQGHTFPPAGAVGDGGHL